MLKCFAAGLITAATLGSAGPTPPCQTPEGIPCFALTFEHSVWALVKSPMRDLITAEVKGTMAVRQDGSFVHLIEPGSRFAVRDRQAPEGRSTRLFLASGRRLIVDNPWKAAGDFRHPMHFFLDAPYRRSKDGDAVCRMVAAGLLGQGGQPAAANASFLGEPVVTWSFKGKLDEVTALLAPGLDCQVLRLEAVEYRYKYLPVRKELFEAKTLRRGEPGTALFQLPPAKGK